MEPIGIAVCSTCCGDRDEDLVVPNNGATMISPGLALDEVPGPYPDQTPTYYDNTYVAWSEPPIEDQNPMLKMPFAAADFTERIVPPCEKNAFVAPEPAELPAENTWKVEGTWIESSGPDGQDKYHCIQGARLTWADQSSTTLEIDDSQPDAFGMDYNSVYMTAKLDAGGQELHWSDGDTWKRAGVDGRWVERKTNSIHTVRGNILSAESREWMLTFYGDHSFSLEVHGKVVTASLDELGQQLVWSDGDCWQRINYEPPHDERSS